MRIAALCAVVLLGSTQLAWSANDPKPVDRAAIHAALKSVGVLPMRVPSLIPNGEDVARRFEAGILERLRAAGFQVVGAQAMRDIHARLGAELGGIYDPMTGATTRQKVDERDQLARARYLEAHPVAGFVRLAVAQRSANSYSMTAEWDGVKENVTGQSSMKSFLNMSAGQLGHGVVPALSLVLVLEDLEGKEIYSDIGGLQLLSYVRMGWVPKFYDVDPAYLLTDTARDARAMQVVFERLTGVKSKADKVKVSLAPTALREGGVALRVPRERLLADHRRVALIPLVIGPIAQREAVIARYAQLLRPRLAAAGFEVVTGDDYSSDWEKITRDAGGFYDPVTGDLDQARFDAARRTALAAFAKRHDVRGAVFPVVVSRDASVVSGVAKWDGAEQLVADSDSKFGAFFTVAGYLTAEFPALSLQLRIVDAGNATLYESYGGIQPLSQFEKGRIVDVPESRLFGNLARDVAAVDLVTAELLPKAAEK
jgi:hypothetical protein